MMGKHKVRTEDTRNVNLPQALWPEKQTVLTQVGGLKHLSESIVLSGKRDMKLVVNIDDPLNDELEGLPCQVKVSSQPG